MREKEDGAVIAQGDAAQQLDAGIGVFAAFFRSFDMLSRLAAEHQRNAIRALFCYVSL
jgi:hypothetical protein